MNQWVISYPPYAIDANRLKIQGKGGYLKFLPKSLGGKSFHEKLLGG
jgi:hypothetical protein